MAMAAFVAHNEAPILRAVNDAIRSGKDVEAATTDIIARLADEQAPLGAREDELN